ncbi:6-bladed beta-propeller [Maribellus sediminis]|uniref:6-bladed beta-propeller n=1 Tax=Maribellus sediminis TaxID=2696285 RepID=UPI0014315BBB|nr:6-bladed beta-propeller [Maribellus sediminis]
MKNQIKTLSIVLLIIVGIGGCNPPVPNNSHIEIDQTANYTEKELILQDFMDVVYIPLETNAEFVTSGIVMDIGSKYIIVKNWTKEGNIFIFDRNTGKALKKLNMLGKGPEEYSHLTNLVLDEQNNELFVNCLTSKKILVYDLSGNFKRSFNHIENVRYMDVYNYDSDNLIVYNEMAQYNIGQNKGDEPYHMILSKQNGSVTRHISIPFDVIKAPIIQEGDAVVASSVPTIIPNHGNWLLVEPSSDTVYNYLSRENKLEPILVKKPTKDPEIFIKVGTLTASYFFISTLKKVFDFSTGRGFPTSDLMYDKQENTVYEPAIINADYLKKQTVDMTSHPVNGDEIAAFQNLQAFKLVEAYKKNELTGKLKEIAAKLDEESNPVIMLMKEK